jgi:hypothetical protein
LLAVVGGCWRLLLLAVVVGGCCCCLRLLLVLGAFERRLLAFEGHDGWFDYLVMTDKMRLKTSLLN